MASDTNKYKTLTTAAAIKRVSQKIQLLEDRRDWDQWIGSITQLYYCYTKLKKLKMDEATIKVRDKQVREILKALGLDKKGSSISTGKIDKSKPAIKGGGK